MWFSELLSVDVRPTVGVEGDGRGRGDNKIETVLSLLQRLSTMTSTKFGHDLDHRFANPTILILERLVPPPPSPVSFTADIFPVLGAARVAGVSSHL